MEEETQEQSEERRIYYPTVWDSDEEYQMYFVNMCIDNDCLHRAYLEYGDSIQIEMEFLQQEMELLQRKIELHNKIAGQISDIIEEKLEENARISEEMNAEYAEMKAPDQSI